MNHIKRKISLAVFTSNPLNHCIGVVTPSALLISKRPERWQWHVAREIRIPTQNLFDCRAVEEIVVQLPAFSPKPGTLLRVCPKIEVATITVVKKDSVGTAVC